MPKLTATSDGNENQKTRCLGFLPKGTVLVAVGSGKAEATGFFVFAATAGARILWLGCRAEVRGGLTDESDKQVQIGLFGPTYPLGCVGLVCSDFRKSRRAESARVCWRPCLRRHGHEAGGSKSRLCLTLTSWSKPYPSDSWHTTDRHAITGTGNQRPAPRGQAKKVPVSQCQKFR